MDDDHTQAFFTGSRRDVSCRIKPQLYALLGTWLA
ncbi:hypothetical protein Q5512_05570 [Escherichia coli]|nr:hypothetical protein [Escherichia coli]